MPKKKERNQEPVFWLNPVVELLKGGVLAVFGAIVVLLLATTLVTAGVLGRGTGESCAIVACVLGALFGGLYAIRRCGRTALLVGLGTGAVQFALLLILGAVCYGAIGAGGMLEICVSCLCGGALAGVLSAVVGKRRKKR